MGERMRAMALRGTLTRQGMARPKPYSDEWYTPCLIPQALGIFDLDPCAGPMNHAVRNFRRIHGEDGLTRPWFGRVWLNPPYSNVHEWLERMIDHNDGIALVNARPETQWFQRAAAPALGCLWLQRRIDFIRPDGKPTHPPVGSVLLAYGEPAAEALRNCGLAGLHMSISRPL
jgi:hypothetical protein